MTAYFILILAALSRCVPHWMHSAGIGATAAGAGLLFFGSRLQTGRWRALFAVVGMACTDMYLTVFAYGYAFHPRGYLLTWCWYAVITLFGAAVLSQKQNAGRVIGAALFSSTGFFLWSNAAVWWSSHMYAHTANGLMQSYVAGLPFYRNDAVATLLLCGLLFGVPVVWNETVLNTKRKPAYVRER